MPIYAVIHQPGKDPAEIENALIEKFSGNFLPLSNTAWLVAGRGTAQEISKQIGVTDGAIGSAIVIQFGSYFGFAGKNIWEWIAAKWEETAKEPPKESVKETANG